MSRVKMFEIVRNGETVLITPAASLSELDNIETDAKEVYALFGDESIKNLLMDFNKTDYFGSTALGFFVRLWKLLEERHGRMAFYNLSEHEREILHITKLDTYWAICDCREEAEKAIKG